MSEKKQGTHTLSEIDFFWGVAQVFRSRNGELTAQLWSFTVRDTRKEAIQTIMRLKGSEGKTWRQIKKMRNLKVVQVWAEYEIVIREGEI